MTEEEKRLKLERLMRGLDSADNATQVTPSAATSSPVRIQLVFLFGKTNMLKADEQESISNMVLEEYCNIFSTAPNKVKVVLCDGTGNLKAKYDLVLNIASGERIFNEGTLQETFRKRVSARLWKILPREMNFSGKVGIRNGALPEIPESTSTTDEQGSIETESPTRRFLAEEPRENFERLQLPEDKIKEIERAVKRIELEREVFKEWGLYAIMPEPICALNFYGPPGTGKTLAADALANKLGKKIIRASYAEIESKYHGEGPKNVQAIFKEASEQDALLFIDEADSLLSKRLTNVTQGSEQAINSMRSQILICLEKFHGIVIFASNLVVNYDRAFVSRLTNIKFDLPDEEMREKIWKVHLLPTDGAKVQLKIPLSDDIDFKALAKNYQLSGRSIRNAVVNACVEARSKNMPELTNEVLIAEIERELARLNELAAAKDHTDMSFLSKAIKKTTETATTVKLKDLEEENRITAE